MKIPTNLLFSALFLASGASLLVYIFAGISLAFALVLAAIFVTLAGSYTWLRSSPEKKEQILIRMRIGFMAGLLGTAAYDLSRFLLIKITGIHFWPFDIFNIFGRAILGPSAHGFWVAPVGLAFHFLNGITFAISYTILLGKRGPLFGILWALGLEILMVVFYPRWLNIKFMNEFISVSVFGHLIYGIVIGYLAKRLLIKYPGKGESNDRKIVG